MTLVRHHSAFFRGVLSISVDGIELGIGIPEFKLSISSNADRDCLSVIVSRIAVSLQDPSRTGFLEKFAKTCRTLINKGIQPLKPKIVWKYLRYCYRETAYTFD